MRPPRMLTVKGQTLTLHQWAKLNGVKPSTIHMRLAAGYSDEDAVKPELVKSRRTVDNAKRAEQRKRNGLGASGSRMPDGTRIFYAGIEWPDGTTETLGARAKRLGVPYGKARARWYGGWPLEDIFPEERAPAPKPEVDDPDTQALLDYLDEELNKE